MIVVKDERLRELRCDDFTPQGSPEVRRSRSPVESKTRGGRGDLDRGRCGPRTKDSEVTTKGEKGSRSLTTL